MNFITSDIIYYLWISKYVKSRNHHGSDNRLPFHPYHLILLFIAFHSLSLNQQRFCLIYLLQIYLNTANWYVINWMIILNTFKHLILDPVLKNSLELCFLFVLLRNQLYLSLLFVSLGLILFLDVLNIRLKFQCRLRL